MPAMHVQSSIDIAASSNKVLDVISDFNTWPTWSPWLYTEPDASVTYKGEAGKPGHGYEWRGNKVGAGGMTLISSDDQNLHCDLTFLKPFKSQADVAFELGTPSDSQSADTTSVVWSMQSKLPFFMFFMKGMMVGMIRSDYNRGLLMLKDYIETGSVPSTSSLMGVVEIESANYIGFEGESGMQDLSSAMSEGFDALMEAAQSASIDIAGPPMCFYNRMDIKRGECKFTVALPTSGQVALQPPMSAGSRPACKALKLLHTGAYRHLGNAWATLMGEARNKKLKINKQVVPFERYMNDPDHTAEAELLTELYLPLR